MNKLGLLLGTLSILLVTPLAASAAKLSLTGRVELTSALSPVGDARVTVTFHGHEVGIHEYTTTRTVRARTDEFGNFIAETKVSNRRYTWTHATVEIGETEISKKTQTQSICQTDPTGGCQSEKDFQVRPL
ncbi:MAG: hypothetical protein AAFX01_07225 [Cyanobacteria bacterium J06638_28]